MEDFTCECGVFFYWESVFVGEGKIGKGDMLEWFENSMVKDGN